MGRSTVHYADNKTNNALKKLHNKLRPAGTPVQRVEYIIELLLLRIFETKVKQDDEFKPLRKLFSAEYIWLNLKTGKEETNENRLFSYLPSVSNEQILSELNDNFFPFYSTILHSARKVFEGNNLPQKVQDQLVLIEEVFSNSNFTNNVNSGNLGEVISIVASEIEESRLLQTDLLGDAIESALSETGGTKDIGLFRTPDHIRQFMTALVEPTFDDKIFDPACGTGGFLFDSFEFVMRRVDPDRKWATEKAHTELSEWFNEYFKFNQIDFPSIEQATEFYRTGVAGIEYLGMIRKMAAINFYIRGLNPANIEQGDSLAKYKPITDFESKSIIVANPPFGAERDQEAYPDVWQEYSKESETTILFVKLMFEMLKQGGRCAVIVSEGFHTWDQFSAKALRKMLLEEAQLKAVISLPQGLFVSKSGQGPKTSILLFEKGGKTDWTWFYKVTNDGYTVGTNRKEQKGNQLVECLNLYHEYVKHGKKPPETKHQFCISANWIKTLDPRIKEKIRIDTRIDIEAKGEIERKKKEVELDKKVDAKKITEEEKQIELKVFNQTIENRVQNEIAKRIDKAHSYSFNLANYKSSISDSQVADWTGAILHIETNGVTTLDEIYTKISSSKPENVLPYLKKLNPYNTLEADIVREYINRLEDNSIVKHRELHVIKSILKKGAKYPTVSIKETCHYEKGKLPTQATEEGVFPFVVTAKERKSASEYQFDAKAVCIPLISSTGHGSATMNRIHYQEGKFALANLLFAAIPKNPSTELFPKFLYYILDALREELFCPLMKGTANVGMRMEDAINIRFPLPDIEIQKSIVTKIEKQQAIIDGANKILKNWSVTINIPSSYQVFPIGKLSKIETGATPDTAIANYWIANGNVEGLKWFTPKDLGKNDYKYISNCERKISELGFANCSATLVPKNSILISTRAPIGYLAITSTECCFNQGCKAIIVNEEVITPSYLYYYLLTKNLELNSVGTGTTFKELSKQALEEFKIEIPSLDEQNLIVEQLDTQMELLQSLRNMKCYAELEIRKIVEEVWDIKTFDLKKEKVNGED